MPTKEGELRKEKDFDGGVFILGFCCGGIALGLFVLFLTMF